MFLKGSELFVEALAADPTTLVDLELWDRRTQVLDQSLFSMRRSCDPAPFHPHSGSQTIKFWVSLAAINWNETSLIEIIVGGTIIPIKDCSYTNHIPTQFWVSLATINWDETSLIEIIVGGTIIPIKDCSYTNP